MSVELPRDNVTPSSGAMPSARGLYVVTDNAQLGVFGERGEWILDRQLSEALAPQLRELLASYLRDPQGSAALVGLLYSAPEPRPWNSATLLLDDGVVRHIYPVGGPPSRDLTAFQKKNREKSVYRGVELLIDYRDDAVPDEVVYCPLLFDRGTRLGQYPWAVCTGAKQNEVRVAEVLNLMSVLPSGRRNMPEVAELIRRIRHDLIRKDLRRATGFTLAELPLSASEESGGAFFDVDRRHERHETWPERLAAAELAQQMERVAQVEKWLERPHRPVDPALLRRFLRFRDLENEPLVLLAAKALVHTAPAGVTLLAIGAKDAWNMFLLEGTLSLAAPDGGSLLVSAGSTQSASPISFLKPRKYTVASVTPVSFLWVHDALLDAVHPRLPPGNHSAIALKR